MTADKSFDLLVFDLYGTIGREDEISPDLPEGQLRRGTKELLMSMRKKGIKVVLFTDYPYPRHSDTERDQKFINNILVRMKIREYFDGIYTGSDCDGEFKDLDKISKDYGISSSGILLIGNGDKDENSARRYGANFIRVPTYFKDELKDPDKDIRKMVGLSKWDYDNIR